MKVDLDAYRESGPAAVSDPTDGGLRQMSIEFLGGQGASFWLRARPLGGAGPATAEEVAAQLYGSSAQAFHITAAAPLFGFDSVGGILPGYKEQLREQGANQSFSEEKGGVDAVVGMQPVGLDPAAEILKSPFADEAALAQAQGKPSGDSREAILERMRQGLLLLEDMAEPAAKFGLSGRLGAAAQRIDEKSKALQAADGVEVVRWDVHSTKQLSILQGASSGLAEAAGQLGEMTEIPGAHDLPAYIRQPLQAVAAAYVDAAANCHLVGTAAAKLAAADQRMLLYPADMMEGVLHYVQTLLTAAQKPKKSGAVGQDRHADYDVEGLAAREELLRVRLGDARAAILNNPAAAGPLLAVIVKDVTDLQLETELVGNMDALDAVWDVLASADGPAAYFTFSSGDLEALEQEAQEWHGRWRNIHAMWKAGAKDDAKQAISKLRAEPRLKTFLSRANAQVKDARIRAAILQIATTFAVTLVSMGVGTFVTGVAMGARLGATAVFLLGTTAEAATFSLLNAALLEENPSLGKLGGEFAYNLALFGALKGFSRFANALNAYFAHHEHPYRTIVSARHAAS